MGLCGTEVEFTCDINELAKVVQWIEEAVLVKETTPTTMGRRVY